MTNSCGRVPLRRVSASTGPPTTHSNAGASAGSSSVSYNFDLGLANSRPANHERRDHMAIDQSAENLGEHGPVDELVQSFQEPIKLLVGTLPSQAGNTDIATDLYLVAAQIVTMLNKELRSARQPAAWRLAVGLVCFALSDPVLGQHVKLKGSASEPFRTAHTEAQFDEQLARLRQAGGKLLDEWFGCLVSGQLDEPGMGEVLFFDLGEIARQADDLLADWRLPSSRRIFAGLALRRIADKIMTRGF